MWDPAEPGAGPVELGRHDGGVGAVAVLPDGRVVTGGGDGPGAGVGPGGAGRRPGRARPPRAAGVGAVAVLPDGRVVTGGGDGRVLVWDPAEPGTGPVELGRHERGVGAVAVLPDGRVVTGGGVDGRVLVWDPAEPGAGPVELGRHEGGVRRWRCCRTGGWSPAATTAGCWCGTRVRRSAARSSSAATSGGVRAVAVLPDGRVVTGGGDGAGAGVGPGGAGRRPGRARPPRGRGGGGGGAAGRAGGHRRRLDDGRVLVWDPAEPGAGPVELGRHEGGVGAVAVLPDGRVVTGGGVDGAGAGVGPGGAGHRPGRARPPRAAG